MSVGSFLKRAVGAVIDPIGTAIGYTAAKTTGSPYGGLLGGVGGVLGGASGLYDPSTPGSNAYDPAYADAAQRDWAMNQQALAQQTWANRPTIETPTGTQSWTPGQAIDPSTGKPVTTWSMKTQLTPAEDQALKSQQAITQGRSGAAQTLLGQATGAFDKPFDWANLPPAAKQAAQAGNVQQSQNAAYDQMRQMLEPGRTQQQASLDTRLANMGLSGGSEANRRANMQLSDQWAQQDRQMMGQAMQQGLQNVQGQYGLDSAQLQQQQQVRQQAIAEQAQQRGMPLNELNSLLSGQQVSMPQMPGFNAAGFGQPAQNLSAQQMAGNQSIAQQQMNLAEQPNWGAMIGAGATIGAAML